MTSNKLLTVTSKIGSMLISYGAEIYRAEESVNRIAAAYGFEKIEVFAIPACLIITIDGENGLPITRQVRITKRETNLDRVDKINNLSRFICSEKPSFSTITTHINKIQNRKTYGFPTILASYIIVGATFALFFGGGWRESVAAGAIAAVIKPIEMAVAKVKPSVFFSGLICSMSAAAIAVLIAEAGLTDGFDKVIIGSLMTLVPGVTLTNCMRDFIAGDFIAGLYTMIEALLTAVGMAVGAASAIALLTNIFGG